MVSTRNNYGLLHGIRKFLLNTKQLLRFQSHSKKDPTSRLVLLVSYPRSGTHALASMINHPAIGLNYYGEFFIFNQWSPIVEYLNKYIPFFSWRYFLNTRRQKRNWMHYRFEKTSLDPIKTVEKILAFPGTHTIKIFPEHLHFEVLENLVETHKPHVVILRRNHLDRYVSLKKANATGKWHEVNSSEVEIEIRDAELQSYITKYEAWYSDIKKLVSKNHCSHLDIDFKQLQDPAITRKIQEFVSVDGKGLDQLPQQPTTTKMDKSSKLQDDFLKLHNKKHSDYDFVGIK